MSSYTCISCRVAFTDGEVQRAHYKTDWHRYNLKRKVADMPPVTAENFQERVLSQRVAAEKQLSDTAATEGCAVCSKKFSSINAYQNHLQSHKHLQAEKQALLAAQKKVDKMNEKGLGEEKEDRDARNEALQQVLKEQQRPGPAAQAEKKPRTAEQLECPPRMMWLEEQAKRREKDTGATAAVEEWEDVEGEDDDMEEEEEEDEEEEEEETMDQEEGAAAAVSAPRPAALPGSIPVTDCLFCSHHSKSLMKNVAHMTRVHSFFIPDLEFLVDLKGLMRYLGELWR
ncbi:zinc finger protein 622-like isoform X2 [Trematomus bernacchii]|uniref:zinc finger protein 622-like isoform X2 n=1 Tax=Trematomus bernacchii TaxID=40690 RepID=UPI00146B2956|nr:zinc finger protein 622-like isoform X2 [Trematomus bernacchii]